MNYENIPLPTLGRFCRKTRQMLGFSQQDVAIEIGTSGQNVSMFERGKNNSALILMWYVRHGLSDVMEICKNG